MSINFKEIQKSNLKSDCQDEFELFARDFFKNKGFKILEDPARGPDGGSDLVLEEKRKGISGNVTYFKWLVSCKHYAHSGRAIGISIETDIRDRVEQKDCQGFMGFYSTISTNSLKQKLESFSKPFEFIIYDCKKIEKDIIGKSTFDSIFSRYFPISYAHWRNLNLSKEPVRLFDFYINTQKEKFDTSIDIFLNIYHKAEYILKALYNTSSFKEFIEYRPIYYIVEDTKRMYEVIEKESSIKSNKINDYNDAIYKKIIERIENKYGLTNLGIVRIVARLYQHDSLYIISKNCLLVDKNMDEILRKSYNALTKIIEKI